MLIIRLQRVGRKNQPAFRIVLAEKHRAVKKLAVEILGHYNPSTKEFGVKNPERVKYWIEKRVEISPTVHNLFIDKGLLEAQKVKAWKPKAKKAEGTAQAEKSVEAKAEVVPEAKAENS
ncbi:MAG: 30S ribosomal protein S16 [Candidatus Doudnabacteria bacterium]|nr:30S ribosomal protein S16 [Candidatus Doudnabacteria bacterium]